MARKPKKGYFVRGQFVAEGSELDEQYRRALKGGDAPSKTELKAQSAQLQALGEALLCLGLFAACVLHIRARLKAGRLAAQAMQTARQEAAGA